jgi:signal transduction histidine kinase
MPSLEGPPSAAKLAQLQADFDRAVETAKLQAMAELAAGAGHEINNPLTVISGRAQLLLRDETDPERQRVLAIIVAQTVRIHEMIADMMLFARPPRPELGQVELVKLLDDLVARLHPRAAQQETAICRTGDAGPILLFADPVQLAVALRAICQNALEALQTGGHIEVNVEHRQGTVVVSEMPRSAAQDSNLKPPPSPSSLGEVRIRISDDGPGIKPEERAHVFDPFYSARQAGRGLGLGLCKAWRIVTNHGGRIEVESEPGKGATFTVVLGTT